MAVHFPRRKQQYIDQRMIKRPLESGLPYGRKSSSGLQEDEGLEPKAGTFDRNTMNPEEEEEYPRGSRTGHMRSMEDQTRMLTRTRRRELAKKL